MKSILLCRRAIISNRNFSDCRTQRVNNFFKFFCDFIRIGSFATLRADFSITMMNVKVNSASQISSQVSQSCSCILSFHRCSSLPRLCFYLRHYALHIISSWVTLFTAEKASFRIRLNLIQCRQTFALPHKTQRKRIGIFSGIFGDSEKESKSEINVYEDKIILRVGKLLVMLYYSYMKLKNGTVDNFLQQRMPSRRTSLSDSRRLFCRKKRKNIKI